ncbi:MAG: hypothetical protein NTZ64_17850 [Polaromonas sp.]|nr:hypothetical protein [Polaromonas sp.]
MQAKRSQSGYLMEIPLIMAVVGVLLAVAIPHLSSALRKGLLVLGTLVWIGGLYYMIVIPGWQPGRRSGGRAWRLGLFLLLAGLFSLAVGAYVLAPS